MTDTIHHALPSGTRLEQYELRSVLGTGGFGITYLGWDTRLDGPVAIKEYLPVECAWRTEGSRVVARTGNDQDNFDFGKQRFLEEARTLNRFSEPNIIRVRTFLEANDTAYMVMDYEEGEPLSALLEREGTLDEATLKNLMIPILDGLRAVHREQFLHRDIKPGNIYLRSEGSPVLLDFGAARQALGEHSRSMTGIVTAGYAPFEQYSSRGKQGPWTDLYAIGATMYRAISGQPPVESSERVAAVGEGDPDPLVPATEIGKGRYSEPLLSSIDWMLCLAAKDRPQSVEAVLERLLGRTATQPTATPASPPKSTTAATPPPTATPPQPKRSSAWPLGIGVLVLALLGLGSWAYLNGQNKTEAKPTAPTKATVSPAATKPQPVSQKAQAEQQPSAPQKIPDKTVATANPQPVEPPPALVGHLQINVNVANADIRLDGQPVGTASPGKPMNLEGLKLGTHIIEVEAEGYQALSESTQVKAQQWTQLALELEPEVTMGELIVRSNVSGDMVFINDKAVGATSKVPHRLEAGEYSIRIEKPGYIPYAAKLMVNTGQQKIIRAKLMLDRQPYEPEMISITGGRFQMGSPKNEKGRWDNYENEHTVVVNDFMLSKFEVTISQFKAFIADSGYKTEAERNIDGKSGCIAFDKHTKRSDYYQWSTWKNPIQDQVIGNEHPVSCVSWNDTQSYIKWLNSKTGKNYRLPTEAEWEYAVRGGSTTSRFWGNNPDYACKYANVFDESANINRLGRSTSHKCNDGHVYTTKVGTFLPNNYGLYDMHGNVQEWTCSETGYSYNGSEQRCLENDSENPRSIRGGDWNSVPNDLRSASRYWNLASFRNTLTGFRLAHD
ncbi:MAG: SUMF1/EgtB/PvdO family nonheme iron enzyme [Candidatus Thiodiazotropha taylori]